MLANEQAWYYVSASNERTGPISIGELSRLAGQGEVHPTTLVWSPGHGDWFFAEKIADQLREARDSLVSPAPPATEAENRVNSSHHAPQAESEATSGSSSPELTTDSSPAQEFKPRRASFIFPRIAISLIVSIVIGAILAGFLTAMAKPAWPGLLLMIVGAIFGILSSLAAYRKERYEIHNSRIICHRGGLVSDETTELEIRNITHVKLKLPWLRFKLFGIGSVAVESAGNSKPVVIRVIREPEEIYTTIRDRMRSNGYDLSQKQLLLEDRPAIIGIVGDCLGILFGMTVTIVFALPTVATVFQKAKSSGFGWFFQGFVGLFIIGALASVLVRFLDMRRRTYRVYNDVVVYEEGFLTRENAFIPYENIADSNTKCSFFDRIFGLYDVEISCQGSGSDIKFRRLMNGMALSGVIDQLVVDARQKPKPGARNTPAASSAAARIRPRRSESESVPIDETLVSDLGMHAGRVMVPLLLILPFFPIWVLAMIQTGVRLSSTRYSVRPGSLRHTYRFLQITEREFAYDKITGIVIKQNLWDRMFGTMTLRFWSLGSGQPLEFAHVHANQLDLPALMRQAGIPAPSMDPYSAEASFGFLTWIRARLGLGTTLLLFAAATIVAGAQVDQQLYYLFGVPVIIAIAGFFYAKLYYSSQSLRFHDHHVEAAHGIISKHRYFARYGNIKKRKLTRYPGGSEGALEIFVAGEQEFQQASAQSRNSKQKILRPCSFTTSLLPEIGETATLLDDILSGRVDPSADAIPAEPLETLLESPRAVANSITRLLLLSILLFPLIALLPITIPLTVVRVKRWRYRIELARVVTSWGMLYHHETSILLDRVDSLRQSQGPLNKMCRNGRVTIMTAGSSKPDLEIIDSPDYLDLYRTIRDHSQ